MKSKSTEVLLCLTVSLMLLPVPSSARGGFGGGGGRSFGGGGGRSFGGGGGRSFGGGGGRSFGGGGGRSFGGGGGFGGSGSRNLGGGSFGGGSRNYAGAGNGVRNYGGGNLSNAGRQNLSGGMAGLAGNRGGASQFPSGAGQRDFGSRPSTLPAGGSHFSGMGNMPNRPVQLPSQGGLSSLAGSRQFPTQPINRQNLASQSSSIRNSFNQNNARINSGNRYTNINQGNNYNINRYGGYNGNRYAGYHPGYGYGGYHPGYGYNYPSNWSGAWACAGTAALGTLLGMTIGSIHGSNGDSSSTNVTYQGDTVIVNGTPAGSAEQYYTQAQQLASQPMPAPDMSGVQPDRWEPLGVFALAAPGQTDSTMMIQLAINQNGSVEGNYLNQLTGETVPVHGALDKQTQRISWMLGNNQSTVFDTSLPNLMGDETSVLVHYGADNTQEMVLVRLPAPEDASPPQAAQPIS